MGRLVLVGIDHLSPSGTATLQECEQKYVGKYGPLKIREPGTEATAIGSGFAHALEYGSLDAGLQEYERQRPERDPVLDDPETRCRAGIVGRMTIKHAHRIYLERFDCSPAIERERTYLVTLPGTGRVLQVRVDGYCETGGYLVEDKLRSGSSLQAPAIENEQRQGRQLTAEIYAHWRETGDIIPVRYRLLRKPDPRKLKKLAVDEIDGVIGEHFDTHEKACDELIVERTEWQLRRWEYEQSALAARASLLLGGADVNPFSSHPSPVRNTSACHAYGRECPQLAHCQATEAEPA